MWIWLLYLFASGYTIRFVTHHHHHRLLLCHHRPEIQRTPNQGLTITLRKLFAFRDHNESV